MSVDVAFEAGGFALIESVVDPGELKALAPVMLREGAVGGSRCLLDRPEIAALATTLQAHRVLRSLIPEDHVAVQCTYFEKSSDRNWLVALHQDLSIPVARRVEAPVLRGWSDKEGTVFVQPPPEVLEQLIAVRLHVDACGAEDGPLRLVPGSHRLGVLSPEAAAAVRADRGESTCLAAAGDALVMRPLTLHASSKSVGTSRRRVLHFVFGPPRLPFGLAWAAARAGMQAVA
ncbi:phytanoyl-CoA dioxygenase family protein [Roseateles chitinivorans]|uniref:phytanoyl-CoA dioxygenase family protein n=1 Tax=Roseateles chitinivorans TaxID=2917965 RepID=UPI003D66B183